MRHTKTVLLITALLCVILPFSAVAEGAVGEVWNGGCDLLFRTSNVTVTGEAHFSLEGEQFKTLQLNYVQDGGSSFYGLTLLTPRADGSLRETGWTILADGDGRVYVMEAYQPGLYLEGTTNPSTTLLHRSGELDALVQLGGALVRQMEPMLPEGAVTSAESDGGKTVEIKLAEGQIPEVAVSALSLAAVHLTDRWFGYGSYHVNREEECLPFDDYTTVTEALIDGTARWELKDVDAAFSLDGQGRLTGLRGNARVASVFWDGSVREIEVDFDFTAGNYGDSHVKPFDPDDYGVVPPREYYGDNTEEDLDIALTAEQWDEFMERAFEILEGLGFPRDPHASIGGWTDPYQVSISIDNIDGTSYYFAFTEDGALLTYQNFQGLGETEEKDGETASADALESAKALARSFLTEVYPALSEQVEDFAAESLLETPDGVQYLTMDDASGENTAYFIIRLQPSLQVEFYIGEIYDFELYTGEFDD